MSKLKKNPFKNLVPSSPAAGSYEEALLNGGRYVSKTITLDANNTTEQENIFQVIGSVEILGIFGKVADAAVLVNCTDLSLQLYDGTNTVQITAASGVNISGFGVGAILLKDGLASAGLEVANNDQCRLVEAAANDLFNRFKVLQKASTNTYIRLQYSTTDTPIDAQIEWHVLYRSIDGGTLEAV